MFTCASVYLNMGIPSGPDHIKLIVLVCPYESTILLSHFGFHPSSLHDELQHHPYTYLLTPWRRVLLEKLTVNFAASQEIPRIYGTRKFLTVPTSACHNIFHICMVNIILHKPLQEEIQEHDIK
jgi:hypothetical protein